MAEPALKAETRTDTGRRRLERMREAGRIPGVICERGKASISVSFPTLEFGRVLAGGAQLIDLSLGDDPQKVLIKKVQYDALGEQIMHVDFQKVSLTEKVEVEVEVVLKGKPVGVSEEGGSLMPLSRQLRVSCLPTGIPSVLELDVSEMKMNEVVHASSVPLPQGVTLISEPETAVCSVVPPKAEEEAAPEAEVATTTAEPELIRKERTAEDEEAAPPAGE